MGWTDCFCGSKELSGIFWRKNGGFLWIQWSSEVLVPLEGKSVMEAEGTLMTLLAEKL